MADNALLAREIARLGAIIDKMTQPIPAIPAIPAILPTGDHDTLTALVVSVANLDKSMTEKFIEIRSDIKGISDGTSVKIGDHETRLRSIEQDNQNFKGKYAIIAIIIMFVIGLIGSFANNVISKLFQ